MQNVCSIMFVVALMTNQIDQNKQLFIAVHLISAVYLNPFMIHDLIWTIC